MTNTIKFSAFATASLNQLSETVVGIENTVNVKSQRFLNWTVATRPVTPFNGLLGINTDLQQYEYWDAVASAWVQLSTSSIDVLALLASHLPGEGASLIGLQNQSGVTNKTVQDFANAQFIVQVNNGSLENAQALGSLISGVLKSATTTGIVSVSIPLTSIDSLTTVANQMIYTTASNVYATTTLTALARTLLAGVTTENMRDTLLLGPMSDGDLIIGVTGSDPHIGQLTEGSGVTITPGPGTITISATGSGGTVTSISAGTGITLTPNPITTTGSVALTVPVAVTLGGTGLIATTINQLLYSSANNVIAGLPTANSSVLITSAGGVPSLSTVLPGGLTTTDPTLTQGVATKNYVDNIATGGGAPVVAASTGALTVTQAGAGVGATLTNAGAQATFMLDGQSPTVGQRVLIKNQAGGSNTQNGVYTVTNVGSGASNWVLTRATDYDTPSDINNTGIIPVENGTINASTGWLNTTTMVTVDTTAVTFVIFGVNPITIIRTVKIQTFTTGTSTYTPSTGMLYCTIEICGGGGGSGGVGSGTGTSGASAGGGGGGYCRKTYTAALIGASATIVIGAGGIAGTNAPGNGGTAGNSTFTPAGAGAILTGNGGSGGDFGTASATVAGATGGSGGSATNGDLNIPGGNGNYGILVSGSGGLGFAGAGGNTPLGTVNCANSFDAVSFPGTNYGVGAAGSVNASASNVAGSAGAAGICIITEYCNQ